MKKRGLSYVTFFLKALIYWVFVYVLYIILRLYGIEQENGLHIIKATYVPLDRMINYAILMGLLIGTSFAIIEFFYDKFISKKTTLWLELVSKILVYLFFIVGSSTFVKEIYVAENVIGITHVKKFWWFQSKAFWVSVLYFMLTSLIFLFIKISIEKFGKNNFLKMLLGTYKKPKEEARIFMFLDLKNSTGIAEQLGHFKYSEFIQECFYDLNSVVSKYDAEIYQYVGDEAVITWNLKKEKANNNCIMLFFAFEEQISSRVKLYKNKFGIIPEFKAGVHAGKLIVVEVGTLKKELAYHGDVINTAARIQSLCNSYNQRLIVSEFLLNRIKLHNLINSTQLGEIALKGKKEKINLFGISH